MTKNVLFLSEYVMIIENISGTPGNIFTYKKKI